MRKIGKYLAEQGWVLRSGGAIGADSAFEQGCDSGRGKKEIFYASNNKGKIVTDKNVWEEAAKLAEGIHPAWEKCNEYARKLHSRNCFQVMGGDLCSPVSLLICWTKNGKASGGTATAINLALRNNIPVYNLFFDNTLQELRNILLK